MSDAKSSLSKRGLANMKPSLMFDFKHQIGDSASKNSTALNGRPIDITSSVNHLMLPDLQKYAANSFKFEFKSILPYADATIPAGLRNAVAQFINRYFCPSSPITPSQILATNGVTSLLEMVPYNLCDAGDGIMYPVPAYGMFRHNIGARNGLIISEVPITDDFDQFAAVNADELVSRFESVRLGALKDGHPIKVLLLSNPCNPLGRCYSRSTMIKLAQYCSNHGLHFVSDEIYAMSVFEYLGENPECSKLENFISALATTNEPGVNEHNVHVLYGASKDFGLGGLRLGFLITRNVLFLETCRRLAMTASISAFSSLFMTQLLSDTEYLDQYFDIYRARLQSAFHAAASVLTINKIPFSPCNSGLFVWVDLSRWLSAFSVDWGDKGLTPELRMTAWLLSKGIFIQPGEAFFSPMPGKFRLVYTSESENVAAGLRLLIEALHGLDNGGANYQPMPCL